MTTLLVLAFLIQGGSAGDGEAREAVRKAADALKKLQSISYPVTWFVTDSRSTTRFECQVKARRPGHLRQEGAFIAPGRHDPCTIVFDGETEWCLHDQKTNRYFRRPQVLNRAVSTWEDPVKLFFFDQPFTSWMEFAIDLKLTPEKLDETACSVVEWRIRYTTDVRWRLWIDEASRIRRLEKFVGGRRFMHVEYGKFALDPKFDDATFRLELPAGAKEDQGLGRFESNLIAVDAEAPAFEARTLDGKDARLSDWKGKPVLFITWSFP